jgi:hypothetical protein
MKEVRSLKRCGLFKPGHEAHWIQALRGSNDRDNPPVRSYLIEVRDDGTVVIGVEQKELRLWNHDPHRLTEAIDAGDGEISYQPRWGLLWVHGQGCSYLFCVAKSPENRIPCPIENPIGTPFELLNSAGGFTVAVDELKNQLEN